MEKTRRMLEIEKRIGEDLESFLRKTYVKKYQSTTKIASKVGVDISTICGWLIRYNIPIRTLSETKLKGKKKPSKEELERWYIKENKNTYEIADMIGVSDTCIGKWLKEYNILTRTTSEAMLKGKKKPSKEELKRLYLKENKTTIEIADILKVTNSTIGNWLKDYNIKLRTISEIQLKGKKKPSKEELEKWYIKENKNTYEIAEMIGVSGPTIVRWLKQYNIPIRSNKHRITSKSQYKSFIEQNPTAKKLSALSTSANGLSGAILDRLIQLYPNQLKKARTQIPKWIESLGKYLGPYTLPLRGDITPSIDALLTDLPEQIKDDDFQQIIFSIVRDTYMQQFNDSPKGTLKSLEIAVDNEKQSYIKELKKQVYQYYSDVYNLEIPGIKPLRN